MAESTSRFAHLKEQQAVEQEHAKQREFNMFIVETSRVCFSDCVRDFNESEMSSAEHDCFRKCVEKTMNVHHLVAEPMEKLT